MRFECSRGWISYGFSNIYGKISLILLEILEIGDFEVGSDDNII